MRAALLAVLAAAVVLAPQAARAHGDHERVAAPPAVTQALSVPCAPGGTGHVCGCGNLSLCNVRGKAAVVSIFVSYVAAPGPSARIASHPPAAPHARPDISPASPRAPPPFL